MPKFQTSLFFILIPILLITCSSAPKVKPKPSEGDFEQCPNCHGTGIIMVRESARFTDDLHNRDKEKDQKAACCLLPVWLIAASEDEDKRNDPVPKTDKKGKPVIREGLREGFEYDQELERNVPERSIMEKPVTCPRCGGKGWIPYIPQQSPQEPYNYQNLRELNKRINSPSKP